MSLNMRLLTLFLLILVGTLGSVSCQMTTNVPPYLQNTKWVMISKYDGVYSQTETELIVEITADSMRYTSTYIRESYVEKWQIKEVKESNDTIFLYKMGGDENSYYSFAWVDEEQKIAKMKLSENIDVYNGHTSIYVIDSANLHQIQGSEMEPIAIKDVEDYPFGISKPGILVDVAYIGDNLKITMANILDQANYDPFTNLSATLFDFEKVAVSIEFWTYDHSPGAGWDLTAQKTAIHEPQWVYDLMKAKEK